jgi:hypothetical protein
MRSVASLAGYSIIAVAVLSSAGLHAAEVSMGERTLAKNLAVDVHDALSLYINVHNDVFELKARRFIPIPSVFGAIDFATHVASLVEVEEKLGRAGAAIHLARDGGVQDPRVDQFLVSLDAYRATLLKAVQEFKLISEKLHKRRQNPDEYRWDTYQNDMDRYQRSSEAYSELGTKLNGEYQWIGTSSCVFGNTQSSLDV